jgi:putative oxidoreductase
MHRVSIKGGWAIYTSVSTIKLLRYSVSYVFIISGLMKLISGDLQNYFLSLGLPYSHQVMYLVAFVELICGVSILANRGVKKAAIPLIIIMIGAILITKVPVLHSGFMPFAFNARLDIIMLVLLFILYSRNTSIH